ncbi:metal ABC transporter ATP-binding protein [Wolbachia endosymbiont of Atemnus politus]|uniref:metal ABC transporter ATP-binding protein n=1 Tax=Wolbachia endosymbiont of Atemnus politus TaxID=2682840 RepID=UPI0015748FC5|nr:metal ABC transporter ATP-binding protein [Wolbachia endosymbiont of Atemnus politus]NSM56511.1 metal ABC transporter ATP-binding protein [Wolbachia endosymbiont of Atemnus politus]NSX83181.1 ATP-binding cassette domain-containing protein [Wolbachia endosymbiont of Atemnus politus]
MSHENVEKNLNFVKKLNNVNTNVLKIENLALAYDNKKVLDDVNISVKRGDIVTILGPNGGGKTSLVKVVAGINKSYTGSVVFTDDTKIGYVPQNFSISNLMPITVEYFLLNSFSKKLEKNQSTITEVVNLVGISNILKSQVSEISAGQTQLLLLARCLIAEPDLIILDEPVSAVDINARAKFYDIIGKIAKERLISILMTSHDLSSIAPCSDYIICINHTIYCQGKPDEIMKSKTLREIFSSYIAK